MAEATVHRKSWPVIGLVTAVLTVIADQVSKHIAIGALQSPPRTVEVLPVFDLSLQFNTGISFSLFNSGEKTTVIALILVEFAITAGFVWWMWKLDRPWLQIASGLIIGGAVGNNMIDRVFNGAVTDFLSFHWHEWVFPTFNLADTAITVGAVMWLLDALFAGHHDAPANKDTAA